MKALSIMPYYASCIATGEKVEEYRSWKTDYRGELLICASSRNEGPDIVRGHALCVVDLFDITERGSRDYVWHIRNVRFVEPFPVKGKLHLYDVEDDKIVYLTKGKGRLQRSYTYVEARNYWLTMKLIRELKPEEYESIMSQVILSSYNQEKHFFAGKIHKKQNDKCKFHKVLMKDISTS